MTTFWLKSLYKDKEDTYWDNLPWVSDPTNSGRPGYQVGDHLVIYWPGTLKCPGIVRVTAPAELNPGRVAAAAWAKPEDARRWGWVTEVEVLGAVPLATAPALSDI